MKNIFKKIDFNKVKIILFIIYLWFCTLFSIILLSVLFKNISSYSILLYILFLTPSSYLSKRLWNSTKNK
jgi:hypothetical protein